MSNTKEKIDELEENTGLSFTIESADQMYQLVLDWHTQLVGVLNHMLSIPEGTIIEDSEGIKHELSNEYLEGFKSGVEVALIELSNFPIHASSTSDEPA